MVNITKTSLKPAIKTTQSQTINESSNPNLHITVSEHSYKHTQQINATYRKPETMVIA